MALRVVLVVVALVFCYLLIRRSDEVQGTVINQGNAGYFPSWNGEREMIKLKYFKPSEFGGHYDEISQSTLLALDKFRELWGSPVMVSPVEGAIVRHGGEADKTQHNVDLWGESRAVDFFPSGLNAGNAQRAYELAKQAGFSGIGIYSDTRPGWMMHGDTRSDRSSQNPAKWARVNKKYVAISEVFA